MLNQMRADWYKLIHSKLCWVVGGLFALFFAAFAVASRQNAPFSLGEVRGTADGIPLLYGFIGFVYADPAAPRFWEMAYSSTVMNSLLWLAMVALSVQFIAREYQTGTMKLAVSYGIGLYRVYLSKWLVATGFFGILFYAYNAAAFILLASYKHFAPQPAEILSLAALVSLQLLVMAVLSLLCLVLFSIIRHSDAVSTVVSAFMFLPFALAAIYGASSPWPAECLLRINPMYYLGIASRFWADGAVLPEMLLFAAAGISVLLAGLYFILRKQELK